MQEKSASFVKNLHFFAWKMDRYAVGRWTATLLEVEGWSVLALLFRLSSLVLCVVVPGIVVYSNWSNDYFCVLVRVVEPIVHLATA